jgi:2-polyprenyl-3-methyl-5-hydroxy-6-metoxy-1,4-benzoquinol methylase
VDSLLRQLLDNQLTYYRHRAPLHEGEAVTYHAAVRDEIIHHMRTCGALTGQVLELACGTGHFTEPLSQIAAHVDAYDGAPEMLDILNERGLPNVTISCVNIFDWEPARRWDAIFFNNWLAHVPDELLEGFWNTLVHALEPGGRVVFVDVTPIEKWNEYEVFQRDGHDFVRRPVDGQDFEIFKRFWDPAELMNRLARWGWFGKATPIGAEAGRGHIFYNVATIR